MQDIGKDIQDYFIKMAPDFSTFEMVEKYYYDNNGFGDLSSIFYYNGETSTSMQTNIFRGMFLVYSTGTLTIDGLSSDEYTVFPYKPGTQIVIGIKDSAIKINSSTSNIDLMIGVAF
jgi:hypothetical protein